MPESQPDKSQFNPTAKPPLPSPSTANSPSRKRLLGNLNPNRNFSTTPSPQSSISSDSSSDQFRKKTRELPNLSDCHSCKRHVNFTNPKDRLRILDSAWRIVLLCKECIKRVELAEICSYCFGKVSEFECFKCGDCERLIHKDCVVKCGKSPPWSYCHLDLRFSVCVDCWVPNSVRATGRNRGKGVDDSRILLDFDDYKELEDAAKEADCVAEKKLEILAKAKKDALRKSVVAEKAVALANGVLDMVNRNVLDGGKSKGLEDEELALQLHRVINSSPRIAKNFGPVTYSCLGSRKSRNLGFFEKIRAYADTHLNEILEVRTRTENSICNPACENGKKCQDSLDIGMAVEGVLKECNSGTMDSEIHPVLRCYQRRNKRKQMLHSVAKSTQGICNSVVDNNIHPPLRFYRRKNKLRRMLECEAKSTQDVRDRTLLFYRRRKRDRYLSQYRRRTLSSKVVSNGETKNLYDSLLLHDHISALPTPLNYSKILKISSDAPSLQSCDVTLQAFAGESGSCQEQLGKR